MPWAGIAICERDPPRVTVWDTCRHQRNAFKLFQQPWKTQMPSPFFHPGDEMIGFSKNVIISIFEKKMFFFRKKNVLSEKKNVLFEKKNVLFEKKMFILRKKNSF